MIRLEPATEAWLEALVQGDSVFTARWGPAVVEGWAGFPEALPTLLDGLRGAAPGAWGSYLFFDEADGALVGLGGWKGAPVEGAVELGYAVAPARQGRGVATAAVRQLVEIARAGPVRTVVACTLPAASASTTVLERCGFARSGEEHDPDVGSVWRWELHLRP